MPSQYRENAQAQTNNEQTDMTLNDIVCNANKELCICGDFTLPDFILTERIRQAFQDAKAKGTRIRLITEITRDNLNSCKQIMKFAEVRHLEKLVGNFAINDLEYIGQAQGNAFAANLIYRDDGGMVEQQKYFFENLWNNAVIQHDKMSSLEVGVDPEEIKVLSDPHEIRKTYLNLINSAVSDISLIIATPNALQRNYKGGIISMLIEASDDNIGRHFAGPAWESRDGSRIVGTVQSRSDAPAADAIPWLLLTAKAEGREGAFSKVTQVQRLNTAGGNAPSTGCAASADGTTVRVPYVADYYLWKPGAVYSSY